MPGKVVVVVGGQFGSEGKGSVTGYLTGKMATARPPVCVRVGGPNAGHTVYDGDGRKWSFRQIPVGAVISKRSELVIAAGSEIDPPVLEDEIKQLEEGGFSVSGRLRVDAQCTVIEDAHKERELGAALATTVGSTGKGIGAARADRCMREATLWQQVSPDTEDTTRLIRHRLGHGQDVMVEAAQGFGLGSHIGYYPNCTSADGRAIDALHDAGISPWAPWVESLDIWVVLRTYPIRVAGPSGPLHREITFEELSARSGGYVEPEYTTVTKKLRRIGEWDPTLAAWAIESNGGSSVKAALTFFDYDFPEYAEATEWSDISGDDRAMEYLLGKEAQIGTKFRLLGTGPHSYIEVPA